MGVRIMVFFMNNPGERGQTPKNVPIGPGGSIGSERPADGLEVDFAEKNAPDRDLEV